MKEASIHYCFRSDVVEYLRACERLLKNSRETPLTAHEQEVILLYARKLVEAFL
jgi:hypothetical protein